MKQIIKYDETEWREGELHLFYKGEEVEVIYAEGLVEEFMRTNKDFEYKLED